ncbi:hypothetical protein Baya_3223 [Bagarius yarrelli]|uniref:Uncharacterized protein n=1 Tax=Bagarius yarrelli TaxID=175774 RepID=A0A556TS47_BAGYA|nr:hypothetical protein Baya_3223 [Bagarius yarrelli]
MERNDSTQIGACESELDCRAALDNCTGAVDADLSVRCWLHLLTKEYDSALQGDPASLALRVLIALVYSVVCAGAGGKCAGTVPAPLTPPAKAELH